MRMYYKSLLVSMLLLSCGISPSFAQWTQTTGLYGGNITTIGVAPNGNLFAGTSNQGVFLSTNNGASWSAASSGLTESAIKSIAFLGTNVFAGTNGNGVFLSTDNGASWTAVNSSISYQEVLSLAVSGSNLFAGTSYGGIFLSTNNGTSWTAADSGLVLNFGSYPSVNAFAVSETNIYTGTGSGIYRSTNNGISWSKVSTPGFLNDNINAFAISDTDFFAVTNLHVGRSSTNNDSTWTEVDSDLPYLIQSLVVSPNGTSGTNLFAGGAYSGGGVYLSTDNGNSWNPVDSGLANTNVSVLAVSGSRLFAGTQGGGVYLSTNAGTSWNSGNNGLAGGVNVLAFAASGLNLFAGTNGDGVFVSTNHGTSWSVTTNPGFTNNVVNALAVSGANLFAGGPGGVSLSTNNGASWNAVDSGLTTYSTDFFGNPVITTSIAYSFGISGNNIFAGTNGNVFLSTDNGTTWNIDTAGMGGPGNVTAFAFAGANLLAAAENGMYLSTNNGTSWSPVNLGSGAAYETLVQPYAVVASGNDLFAGGSWGIDLSTDNGSSWNPVDSGLAYGPNISAVAISGTDILAGDQYGQGVYLSDNNGATWSTVNSGFSTNPAIYALTISGSNVVAGTANGVWTVPLSQVAAVSKNKSALPEAFSLSQNYPNPFNPTTVISYQVPVSGQVTLKVYDMLGREIATLVNNKESAGSYSVKFDGSRLASGVYFYRLQAGSFSQTKKLLLMK